jgi:NADH dehydrogenase
MARPRVVIVGAGFAGLTCAKALAHAAVEVTLIDRQNHHCFQPLLYQVATAALSPKDVAWPIRSILRDQENVTTLMAEVEGVDREAHRARANGAHIDYDILVIATGATHSYFGHDEWERHAPGLKQIDDATTIRRRILASFEEAELAEDKGAWARLLTFVIVGGGPTGVELAGAIAEIARQSLKREFRRIDPMKARILLLEAGPRILATYPDDLARYAERALTRKGVEIRLGAAVTSCDSNGVETSAGRIEAATIIWAAGVKASPASAWLGGPRDGSGRVQVSPDLTLPQDRDIFVIGDTAAAGVGGDRPVPGIAPAAKQMGAYVAASIIARTRGAPPPGPFRYRHYADLATIGRNAAIVRAGGLHMQGFLAWTFWSVAHIYFLIGARNRIAVAFTWFWDYLTFQRGVRLITRRPSGAT